MPRSLTAVLAASMFGFSLSGSPAIRADETANSAAQPVEAASEKPDGPEKEGPPVKTREVKLQALTLKVPETWKQGEPSNNLRLGEFTVPAVKGDDRNADDEPVELAVFSFGGGGSVQQNIERWIGQFDAAGRKAKVSTGESPQGKYVFVDITGTYQKPVGPPMLRQTERLPDARMLAVILAVPDEGVYYLRMAGPEETVTANAAHLRRSFGADATKEKPLNLDGDAAQGEPR